MRDAIQGYYEALRVLEDSPYMGDEAGRKFIRLLRKEAPDGGEAAIVSLNEAARRLELSRRTLQRCIACGLIRPSRRNGRVFFTEAEIRRFRNAPRRRPGRQKAMPIVVWAGDMQ